MIPRIFAQAIAVKLGAGLTESLAVAGVAPNGTNSAVADLSAMRPNKTTE